MKKVCVEEVDNLNFWVNYFGCSYPNGYDEEEDVSVSELMQELYTEETESWWDRFTGYYEGVLDENDGYLEDPTTLEMVLTQDKYETDVPYTGLGSIAGAACDMHAELCLKIEFHPGDTLYYINDIQFGSTGPHWELQMIPYKEVEQLLTLKNGSQLFLLLLPLAFIEEGETSSARERIAGQMRNYFPENLCERVSGGIVAGLQR